MNSSEFLTSCPLAPTFNRGDYHIGNKENDMIKANQRVYFKPEFQDPGDKDILFVALEDEDGGRVKVVAQLGLPINPVQVVEVSMIECAS